MQYERNYHKYYKNNHILCFEVWTATLSWQYSFISYFLVDQLGKFFFKKGILISWALLSTHCDLWTKNTLDKITAQQG